MSRRHVVAAGSNWLAFAATLAVSFALTPLLVRTLGPPRYDVWCVAEAVLAYFTLLDLGIAPSLVRGVARFRGNADRLNRTAATCLLAYAAAGVAALGLGSVVAVIIAPGLEAKSGHPGDVLPFLLVMVANLAATLPLSVFPGVLDGLEKYPAKSLARVGVLAVRTAGIVAVVMNDGGLFPLAVVITAANLLEHAVLAALCFFFRPGLRFSPRLADRETWREVRGTSTHAFVALVAGRAASQTGALVVGLWLPAGQATLLALAVRLVEYAKTLLRHVTTTLTPGVSAMEAVGDAAGIRALFLTATRWVLYAVLPVNVGLWYFTRPFLHRWVGEEFAVGATPAAAVLAATLGIGVAQSVASRVLYGLGQLKTFARLAVAEAVCVVGLTALLVFPLGLLGAAVAAAVPGVLFAGIVIAHANRVIGVGGRKYLAAWAKPLLATVVPATIWGWMGDVAPAWDALVAATAAGLVPYAAVVALGESLGHRRREVGGRDAADQHDLVPVRVALQ